MRLVKDSAGLPWQMARLSLLQLFSWQVLLFPVLVVAITSVSLLSHGHCAAWQWWIAVGVVLACGFYAASPRVAVQAVLLCALGMFGLWLITGTLMTSVWDERVYHQPAVRLLIDGWNPVYQDVLREIQLGFGCSPDMVRPYHILAMPKSVWYFAAVAYSFCHEPFNVLYPLLPILILSVALTCWRQFSDLSNFGRIVFILMAVGLSVWQPAIIDNCIAVAGFGLLLSMYSYFRAGKLFPFELFAYSFWMCTAKQTSLLHCAIFWCVFISIVLCRKDRRTFRCLLWIPMALMALTCLVCASPYFSSWRDYGHPLYPRYTGNAEEYPVVNITDDFLDRNGDAAQMSHLLAWANGYVWPQGVRAYYRQKTGNPAFMPDCKVWRNNENKSDLGSPTLWCFRVSFVVMIFIVIFFGRIAERIVGIMLLLGTLAMPTAMLGYVRYVPWLYFGLIACAVISVRQQKKFLHWCMVASIIIASGWLVGLAAVRNVAFAAYDGNGIRRSLAFLTSVHTAWFSHNGEVGNFRLLQKHVPELFHVDVMVGDIRNKNVALFCGCYFAIVDKECPAGIRRAICNAVNGKTKDARMKRWFSIIGRSVVVDLPQAIWGRVCNLKTRD